MDVKLLFQNKKVTGVLIASIAIIVVYLLCGFIFFPEDPVSGPARLLLDKYLLLSESIANRLLTIAGSKARLSDHFVIVNQTSTDLFIPELRFKKLAATVLFVIWITRTSLPNRLISSAGVIILHLLSNSLYIFFGAETATVDYDVAYILAIPNSLAVFLLYSFLVVWYIKFKPEILSRLTRRKLITNFLQKKDRALIITVYLFILTCVFLLEYFDFYPWINFLFFSSQKILALLGYQATVDTYYLIGDNGTIYMAKYCLGFRTMFLFAALVMLTGRKDKTRWIYMFSGLIFLNLINILRFVLLFIHIQKNGGYVLSIDLHDLYNYVIYSIIFILWIIWFEKFSDIRKEADLISNK